VRLGKLAVDCGLVVLYEVVDGTFRLTGRSAMLGKTGRTLVPVAEYVATQSRFRGMRPETIEAVQAWVDDRWLRYVGRDAGACLI
jgi:pyruvate ferredoxin oxidoreductase beta subunit